MQNKVVLDLLATLAKVDEEITILEFSQVDVLGECFDSCVDSVLSSRGSRVNWSDDAMSDFAIVGIAFGADESGPLYW